jgi:hypothetical protein
MWLQLVYRCLSSLSDGETVFRHTCELDFEGIVSKRLGSPYRSGRSRHWIKSKNPNAPGGKAGSRRRLGQREMTITQGKMPFVFGMVVLATLLIAAPAAHAACRSPKNICKHFDDCLQRTSDPNNKDADGIRAGVKARNGQIVLAGAEACARDLGRKQQWDKWARGCSELEFVQIARVELELGKVYCDRYSQ